MSLIHPHQIDAWQLMLEHVAAPCAGEFFQSSMDKAPAQERLKDPLVLVALGWLVAMAVAAVALVAIGVQ